MEWKLNMLQKMESLDNIPEIQEIRVNSLIEGIRTLRNEHSDAFILCVKTNHAYFIAIKCVPKDRPRIMEWLHKVVKNKNMLRDKLASISLE